MDYYALAQMASGIGDGNELSGDSVQRFGDLVAEQAAMIEREACCKAIDDIETGKRLSTERAKKQSWRALT